MVLNTYPEVARSKFTCRLCAIEFSCQFLVVEDMSLCAVLGRDFLKPNYVLLTFKTRQDKTRQDFIYIIKIHDIKTWHSK